MTPDPCILQPIGKKKKGGRGNRSALSKQKKPILLPHLTSTIQMFNYTVSADVYKKEEARSSHVHTANETSRLSLQHDPNISLGGVVRALHKFLRYKVIPSPPPPPLLLNSLHPNIREKTVETKIPFHDPRARSRSPCMPIARQ